MIVFLAIVLALNFSQSAHAERSRVESGYLIIPRIDVDDFRAFELILRIEFNGEYLFVLEHASDPAQDTTSSGSYDSNSQTLVVDEIELETGELYSVTLELVSQSPDIVFRLKGAELNYSPSDLSEPTTEDVPLPKRTSPRPETTSNVPHIHPDGSLHASLAPNRAREAVQAGWAISHPWADQREGWEGLVLLYTPRSMEDLDVIFQLIVDSYNFVTGQNIQAADYN